MSGLARPPQLDSARLANESKIKDEHAKANALIALVHSNSQRERKRLDVAASKMSFESLFVTIKGKPGKDAQSFFGNDGISTKTNDSIFAKANDAKWSSTNMLVYILQGKNKRAQSLRSILANKVASSSELQDAETGMYLYILYMGTKEAVWRDKFLAKSQTILGKRRNQPDDKFFDVAYFSSSPSRGTGSVCTPHKNHPPAKDNPSK